MKRTQLLSVVFSLIMFTGVTTGNVAFAKSDDVIDSFEDCVESGYPIMESFPEQCKTDDGKVFVNDDNDRYSLDDRLEKFCEMTDEEKRQLFTDHPRLEQFAKRLLNYCEMSEEEREDAIDKFIAEHFPKDHNFDLDDLLDRYCEMTDEEKRQLLTDHPQLAPFTDRLANYCDLSEEEQDEIDDLIKEHGDKIRAELRDYAKNYRMDYKKDMRMMLDKYCDMTDVEKKAYVAEHDKAEDHVEKMNRYCALTDEDSRMKFIEEHKDEYKSHMEDKMHDRKTVHMDYERFCKLTDEELAASTFDVEFVKKASEWCEMTPEEKKAYKMKHFGTMPHDFDRMSDVAKDRMSDVVKERLHDKMEKFSEKSDHLKAMIMDKRDITDERTDEIRKKFEAKFGEESDKKRSEIKMKYKEHMLKMKFKMSDEQKSDVHERLAEMKAYKAELREKASELSNEEKQQLREEFIEKAKDMQLAWISPRTQMTAGVDVTEVECREGYNLVMKASNGVAMCLKAESALKMIDRGIVVPTN
ncbi:MAG: ABC transporter substrate-binding protein [Nitrosopumilus sp.]|uniref:ABC transporter substrate-binding protein n=1 Tax=Nitrosopumilus sp. TaxID=2024843 RepID=UPI00246C595C|nr:ABC transporter substrate-binding protein [Nitrosopumilus sp.]MDH5431677.1 ABC transporter substrate-binding protein [Nitrosopumilus sp.]